MDHADYVSILFAFTGYGTDSKNTRKRWVAQPRIQFLISPVLALSLSLNATLTGERDPLSRECSVV